MIPSSLIDQKDIAVCEGSLSESLFCALGGPENFFHSEELVGDEIVIRLSNKEKSLDEEI